MRPKSDIDLLLIRPDGPEEAWDAHLGWHATGDNHAEAVGLLKKAGTASHRHLATLLGLTTTAGYDQTTASAAEVKEAARAAVQLVEDARAATPVTG